MDDLAEPKEPITISVKGPEWTTLYRKSPFAYDRTDWYGMPPQKESRTRMTTPETLTTTRKSTHGDWNKQAASANSLKLIAHESERWNSLNPGQQEAIDMILTKVSRIVCGNPNEPDHWDDIAGYAYLGKSGHQS